MIWLWKPPSVRGRHGHRLTWPVLVLGGSTSADWFHRAVQETAAAIPGARLVMVEGFDHQVPPEVIAPVLTSFFLGGQVFVSGALGWAG